MSGRIQREIEEIISRYERSAPRQRRWLRRWRQVPLRLLDGWRYRFGHISLSHLMLLGILLLLIAFFFRSTTPYTVYAGLGLFFVAFVLSFRRSHYHPEMHWRGRVVDQRQPVRGLRWPRWWQRLRRQRRH